MTYHRCLRLFKMVRMSACGQIACRILARTSSLVTRSLYEMRSILREHLISMACILLWSSVVRVEIRQEELHGSKRSMCGQILTNCRLKRENLSALCSQQMGIFDIFCVRSSSLRGISEHAPLFNSKVFLVRNQPVFCFALACGANKAATSHGFRCRLVAPNHLFQ